MYSTQQCIVHDNVQYKIVYSTKQCTVPGCVLYKRMYFAQVYSTSQCTVQYSTVKQYFVKRSSTHGRELNKVTHSEYYTMYNVWYTVIYCTK